MPALAADGHQLTALARDPSKVPRELADAVEGDVVTGRGLAQALHGVEVAYYLVHAMERPHPAGQAFNDDPAESPRPAPRAESFAARERRGAMQFAQAAAKARVRRIVYLGGPLPSTSQPAASFAGETLGGKQSHRLSQHLASRHEVERTLLTAVPDSVALRASIVIGARSRSFKLLVRLVERLPLLALPAWRTFKTNPIDIRDVIEMLVKAASSPAVGGRALDASGPQTLTYEQMLKGIADLMLVQRPALRLPVNATPIAAAIVAAIVGEDHELVLRLMESLTEDLLPAHERAAELLDVALHSFDAAVEHALAEWERVKPLAAR